MKMTYYGHSAFRIECHGATILIDPFLTGNKHFSGDIAEVAKGVTHIALTHGHEDHVGDTVELARLSGAKVIANFELANWLSGQGVADVAPGNTGGTIRFDTFSVTFTQAFHSSGHVNQDGTVTYLGMPNGLVLHFSDGPSVYHMGDTDIFGDMALIQELHHPEIGLVPVGDRFTMGAAVAALACRRYFTFRTVIPIHWGTFPPLDASPERFIEAMEEDREQVLRPAIGTAFSV